MDGAASGLLDDCTARDSCTRFPRRSLSVASPRVDFDLSPEHELFRDTVRAFAVDRVAPVAEELDREGRFPYELVEEMAALGLMGIPFPEELGGAGGDTLAYAIASRSSRGSTRRSRSRSPRTPRSGRCRSTSSATRSRSSGGSPHSRAANGSQRSVSPSPRPARMRVRRERRRLQSTAAGRSTAPRRSSRTRAPTSRSA